jgi:flagellar biosynthesis/type III secretory pathway protein FliH
VLAWRRVIVAALTRTRFDKFAQELVRTALETHGRVETDVEVRLDIATDLAKQTSDDQEFLMNTQDIVETWRREAIQEGVKQGIEEGVKQGIERGVACSLIDIYEARFGAMPGDLRALVEASHDEATLRAWVKLASTSGANEIAAAIRAARAS